VKKREVSFFNQVVMVIAIGFLGGTLAALASWVDVPRRVVNVMCMWTLIAFGAGHMLGRWMEIRSLARERESFARRYLSEVETCRTQLDYEILNETLGDVAHERRVRWADALDRIGWAMKTWIP